MTVASPLSSPPAGAGPAPGRRRGPVPMTPGRRAALLLGVPVVLAVLAATAFSLVQNIGRGSFPVSDTVPLRDGGLTVSLGGGDGTVRGGAWPAAPAAARFSGTVSYALARPAVRSGPGTLGLACPVIDTGNCALSGTLDAPAGATVTVHAGGGDLSVSGLAGAGTLDTGGGTLTVSADSGDLTAASGGGDMILSRLSGPRAALSSDGGTVTAATVAVPQVTVASGGGDVTLTFSAAPRHVRVTSSGGTVKVVLPRVVGGYVVNEAPDGGTVTGISSSPAASHVITVASAGGDIDVEQSPS